MAWLQQTSANTGTTLLSLGRWARLIQLSNVGGVLQYLCRHRQSHIYLPVHPMQRAQGKCLSWLVLGMLKPLVQLAVCRCLLGDLQLSGEVESGIQLGVEAALLAWHPEGTQLLVTRFDSNMASCRYTPLSRNLQMLRHPRSQCLCGLFIPCAGNNLNVSVAACLLVAATIYTLNFLRSCDLASTEISCTIPMHAIVMDNPDLLPRLLPQAASWLLPSLVTRAWPGCWCSQRGCSSCTSVSGRTHNHSDQQV